MPNIAWKPSWKQSRALACPAFELLIWGNRGGGKTDTLLMDFAQDIGKWGPDWRGIIFRREYKELMEPIERSKKWFRLMFPEAKFRDSSDTLDWQWPTGERLIFRAAKRREDILAYLGHEWPWQGWEE